MADGFETIGWVMTVEDRATVPVGKIIKTINSHVDLGAKSTKKMYDSWNAFGPKFIKGWAEVSPKLSGARDVMTDLGVSKVPALMQILENTSDAMKNVFDEKRYVKAESALVNGAREFGTIQKVIVVFGRSMKKVVGIVTGPFQAGLKGTLFLARAGVSAVGGVLQKFLDIQQVTSAIKKVGGIGGVLLGPLGPLMDLFSPLINMITRQFTPAIETFSAIVETAFGPFSMILEMIAGNLATAIVPLIKPLASFLEIAALQVGLMIQSLLKGKPEGIMSTLFGVLKKGQPIFMNLLNLIMDMGKQVGGVLLEGVVELAPKLLEMGVMFLKAILPIIPPLTKLAVSLLKNVFIPMLSATIDILNDHVIPFIEEWMPAVGILIDEIATKVTKFWGNFPKYANDIKLLFIDPLTAWFGGLLDGVLDFFALLPTKASEAFKALGTILNDLLSFIGLNDIGAAAEGVFQTLSKAALAPVETLKAGLNATVIDGLNALTQYEFPLGIGSLRELMGVPVLPHFAEGALITQPTVGLIGEAGPEMALPLDSDKITQVLAPLIPELDFPALDKLLEVAKHIDQILSGGGVLRVMTVNDEQRDLSGGGGGGNALSMAPGLAGMGGAW